MSASVLASEAAVDVVPARDDAAAMQAEFDRCADALHRYVLVRLGGDAHLADDMMQQLWVQARRSTTVVPRHEMEYWLRGIAKNLVRTHWRKKARRPAHLPLADALLGAELSRRIATEHLPDDLLERKEVSDQLLLAITELSAEDQAVIVGYYFEQRSQGELAAERGASSRAIEGRLYRARAALRRKLEHLNPL